MPRPTARLRRALPSRLAGAAPLLFVTALALLAASCADDTRVRCGAGTLRDGERCVPDPDFEAGGPTMAPLDDTLPTVHSAAVSRLVAEPVVGDSLFVGYPLRVDLDLDVDAAPFKADVYVGLREAGGDKACILGVLPAVHQPKAFELAAAAARAQAQAKAQVAPSSSCEICDAASVGKACDAEGERCVGLDAAGRAVPEATGVDPAAAAAAQDKPASERTPSEVALIAGAAQDELAASAVEYRCMNETDIAATRQIPPVPTALDFGGRAPATLNLQGELVAQQHCTELVGAGATLWVAFDPFEDTILEGRKPPPEDATISLDFTSGLAWVLRSEVPTCEGDSCAKVQVDDAPGIDFHTRKVKAQSSVILPRAEVPGEGSVDLTVSVESAIYGTVSEDKRKELEEESVDIAFTLTPVGAPAPACDAKWDGEPRELNVVAVIEPKAGEEPTVEYLEAWLKQNLRTQTVDAAGYSLRFSDELRSELTEGPLRCFEAFQLTACADPEFDEAPGLEKEDNCASESLIFLRSPEARKLAGQNPGGSRGGTGRGAAGRSGAGGSGAASWSCLGRCGERLAACACTADCAAHGDCCVDYGPACTEASPATWQGAGDPKACDAATNTYLGLQEKVGTVSQPTNPGSVLMARPVEAGEAPDYAATCPVPVAAMAGLGKAHRFGATANCSGACPADRCGIGMQDGYLAHSKTTSASAWAACCKQAEAWQAWRDKVSGAAAAAATDASAVLLAWPCKRFRQELDAALSAHPTLVCPTGSWKEGTEGPEYTPPNLAVWLDTHAKEVGHARIGWAKCEQHLVDRLQAYTVDEEGAVQVEADAKALDAATRKVIREELAPQWCAASSLEGQLSVAYAGLNAACAALPQPFAEGQAQETILTGTDALTASSGFKAGGLSVNGMIGIRNELAMSGKRFRLSLGPETRIWTTGEGGFKPFGLEDVFAMRALVHIYSELDTSYFEFVIHALTFDLIKVELKVPSQFKLTKPPLLSKGVKACQSFFVHCVTVQLCGGIGGQLGVREIKGSWQSNLEIKNAKLGGPKLAGVLNVGLEPFVGITAMISAGIDIAIGVVGARLWLDPLAELAFPVEARLDFDLYASGDFKDFAAELTPKVKFLLRLTALKGRIAWFFDGRGPIPNVQGTIYAWEGLQQLYEMLSRTAATKKALAF